MKNSRFDILGPLYTEFISTESNRKRNQTNKICIANIAQTSTGDKPNTGNNS